MNPIDTTAEGQSDAISLVFDLKHSSEKVWSALTDPALLKDWLLPVVGFKLEPGAAFQFHTDPHPGWDGTVHCRMLDVDAPRKIRYAWVVGAMELETIVTFTLEPTEEGTRLYLQQSGFKPSQKQNFGGARYGWNMMGKRLVDMLSRASEASL